jgi:hypothetical protein
MSLAFSHPRPACLRWSGDRAVVEAALGEVCGEGVVVEEAAVAGVAVGMGLTPADVGAESEAGWEGEGAGGARGLGRHGLFCSFFFFLFLEMRMRALGRSDEVRGWEVDG